MSVKENVREKTRTRVKVPRNYKVLIYNDDFTPMEFVVKVLIHIFDKDEISAITLMMSVHKGSYAIVGTYPKDIAQTKVAETTKLARAEGYPLKTEAVCE